MQVDVLAFAAHPDDIELSCSGLMLKLKSQGYKTGIIDLTRGELSSRGNPQTRAIETEKASKILGLDIRENADIGDGNVRINKENQSLIIEYIRKYRPKVVLSPYWVDRHPDHVNTSLLVEESFFFCGLTRIKSAYEAYRPKSLIYYFQHKPAQPSFIVDISDEFDKKMQAVNAFKSQFYDEKLIEPQTYISTPEFLDSIETKAKYYGYRIGVKYGEPFLLKTDIKVDNIVKMFA